MDSKVFVKIEEYEDVVEIIDLLKNKVAETKSTLLQVEELKKREDETLASWKEDIKSVEERIAFLSSSLGRPRV